MPYISFRFESRVSIGAVEDTLDVLTGNLSGIESMYIADSSNGETDYLKSAIRAVFYEKNLVY